MQLFSVRYNIIILIIVLSYNVYIFIFYFLFTFCFLALHRLFSARSKSFAATCRVSRVDAIPPRQNSENKYQSFRIVSGVRCGGCSIAISNSSSRPQYSPQTTRPHIESRRKRVYNTYTHNALWSLVYTAARILYTLYIRVQYNIMYICRTRTRLL
jgi:hypothetical protein